MKSHCFAIIMAGGRGTRFWPLSRALLPKQILRLFGERTLLEESIRRLATAVPAENTYIITGEQLLSPIRKIVANLIPRSNVLAEPAARNTSPAIALATAHIHRVDRRALVAILPSDHLITDVRRFRRVLADAFRVARLEKGGLVTFGIKPDYPETGYGYVERGAQYSAVPGAYSVRAFKEKPDLETAQRFVSSGNYYWNSGMFVWSVESYVSNLQELDPVLLDLNTAVRSAPRGSRREKAAVASLYRDAAATSIDYALLEKARSVYVVEADFGWSDVGSWLSLEKLLARADGDVFHNCNLVADASSRSLVFSPSKLVALIGVSDLIVVDTQDALLVCHRDRSQDVKKIVERLQQRGMTQYL